MPSTRLTRTQPLSVAILSADRPWLNLVPRWWQRLFEQENLLEPAVCSADGPHREAPVTHRYPYSRPALQARKVRRNR
jgi:hypothetical protein